MKFRTEYKPKREFTLDPSVRVVMLGSCFADNMRLRMQNCLWKAENPLGTLYNPLSIERAIRLALPLPKLNPTPDTDIASTDFKDPSKAFEETLFSDTFGICHSWLFDSKISSGSAEETVAQFNERSRLFAESLRNAQALFVTFGTSFCYFLADKPDYVVANCHKQPANIFVRRRISIDEIVDTWIRLAHDLRKFNPGLRIVFTVSPVRHIKDGLEGNARSKAVLLLAVEELCQRLDFCSYFPAYEILNDDLRDYRFYASDLVHPSEQAVEYLWEIFRTTYIDTAGEKLLKDGERAFKASHHRPLINQ